MSIWFFYWVGVAVAWPLLLGLFVRYEFDGNPEYMDLDDWALGTFIAAVLSLAWPLLAAAAVPVLIVMSTMKPRP